MNNNLKEDAYGNIDIEFYVAKAKAERDIAMSELFSNLKATISKKLGFKMPKTNLNLRRHAH